MLSRRPRTAGANGVPTNHYTYDARALMDEIEEGTVYIKFEIKNGDGIVFKEGNAIPWKTKGGKTVNGGAKQIESNIKFDNDIFSKKINISDIYVYISGKWVEDLSLKAENIVKEIICK